MNTTIKTYFRTSASDTCINADQLEYLQSDTNINCFSQKPAKPFSKDFIQLTTKFQISTATTLIIEWLSQTGGKNWILMFHCFNVNPYPAE